MLGAGLSAPSFAIKKLENTVLKRPKQQDLHNSVVVLRLNQRNAE